MGTLLAAIFGFLASPQGQAVLTLGGDEAIKLVNDLLKKAHSTVILPPLPAPVTLPAAKPGTTTTTVSATETKIEPVA